jgi:lipopolysaccharide/colanic/teichoic acid biosynthesis glycosyltransferase
VDDDPRRVGDIVREYSYRGGQSTDVIAGPLTEEMVSQQRADLIVVAIPSISADRLSDIAGVGIASGAAVAFAPRLSNNSDLLSDYVDIDGVLISSLQTTAYGTVYDVIKRICDLLASLMILILAAPFFLLIAQLIRWDSAGPAVFRQLRIGRRGRPFSIYKFRTMHVDAPTYAVHPKEECDPRITRFGQWLRRTSLDELLQLINVLKGEMSLVGPRPEMPFIVETYKERHWQRLRVIPGITGLWQLSADRAFPIHENIHYDLYYIRNRNFFMYIAILLHTFVFAAR